MHVDVESVRALRFDDGSVTRLRVFPPVEGLDEFSERDGTKHLKPDLEAACEVDVDGDDPDTPSPHLVLRVRW